MIFQVLEVWEGMRQSREQKHQRLLESLKGIRIREEMGQEKEQFQIRFIYRRNIEKKVGGTISNQKKEGKMEKGGKCAF